MIDLQLKVSAAAVPYVHEWMSAWSIEPRAAQALTELIARSDIGAHLARVQAAAANDNSSRVKSKYRTDIGSVALLQISGVLMKQEPSLMAGSSTVALRREVRAIATDGNVGCVLLAIDSPGGSVSGLDELASEISRLPMPVHAFASDCCCSAAYLLGCCAEYVSAERSAMIGSIGTYLSVIDSSVAAATQGIKVHLVRSEGAIHKGVGSPGVPISDDQLKNLQSIVDSHQSRFNERVSTGRKMSMTQAKLLADGAVYDGPGAKAKSLIDDIGDWDQALSKAQASAKAYLANRTTSNSKGKPDMSSTSSAIEQYNKAVQAEMKSANDRYESAIVAEMQSRSCSRETAIYRLQRRDPSLAKSISKRAAVSRLQARDPELVQAYIAAYQDTAVDESSANESTYFARLKELQKTGMTRSAAANYIAANEPDLAEQMLADINR